MAAWPGTKRPTKADLTRLEGDVDELSEDEVRDLAAALGLYTSDNPPLGVLKRRIKGSEVR